MAALRGKGRPLCVCLVVCFCLGIGGCDFVSDDMALRSAVLTNSSYSVETRPDFLTNVSVSSSFSSLNSLDIASQSMTVSIKMRLIWYDSRLKWDAASYGGLLSFLTDQNNIWTPQVVIDNSVDSVGVVGGKETAGIPLTIVNAGYVIWTVPMQVKTSCKMNIRYYPYDTQSCDIVLVTWQTLAELQLTSLQSPEPVDGGNGEFEMLASSIATEDIGGPALEMTFRKNLIRYTFRRRWQFYGLNLMMPIVVNSILMAAVFLLPIESGEKMGYSLTVLLSYIVFLTWVTDNLPPVSTDTCILQVYLAFVLSLGCLATLLSTWVLRVYHSTAEQPMNVYYRKFAASVLVPFYDLTHLSNKKRNRQTDVQNHHHDDHHHHHDLPNNVTTVKPLTSRRLSVEAHQERPLDGDGRDGGPDVNVFQVSSSSQDRRRGGGRDTTRLEERPDALTWPALAALLDYFFLWVFGSVMVIVTTVIIVVLYDAY